MKLPGIGKSSKKGRGTEIRIFSKCLVIALIGGILIFSSCSHKDAVSADPVADVIKMGECLSESDVEAFYSKGTVEIAHKLEKKNEGSDVLLGLDAKLFVPGMKYEIVSTLIRKDRCQTEFIITEHPDMNFSGMTISIMFKNENGKWKIDREKELKTQL